MGTVSVHREGGRCGRRGAGRAYGHDTQDLGHTFKRKKGGNWGKETTGMCQEWVG